MSNPDCEYCEYTFTDDEIDDGESHIALGKIELRCPKCFSFNVVSIRDVMPQEDEDI